MSTNSIGGHHRHAPFAVKQGGMAGRSQRMHEALQVGGAADGDDDDAFGLQVAAASAGECFECGLVAPAFDENGGAGVGGGQQVACVVGG